MYSTPHVKRLTVKSECEHDTTPNKHNVLDQAKWLLKTNLLDGRAMLLGFILLTFAAVLCKVYTAVLYFMYCVN